IIGAGFMGRGIAYQIQTAVPGMRLAAVSSRNAGAAERAYREAGTHDFVRVTSREALESAIAEGRPVVTQDGLLVAAADGLDVVIEATGDVEFGAHVALACFDARRHLA